jgi:hypothetical protein
MHDLMMHLRNEPQARYSDVHAAFDRYRIYPVVFSYCSNSNDQVCKCRFIYLLMFSTCPVSGTGWHWKSTDLIQQRNGIQRTWRNCKHSC